MSYSHLFPVLSRRHALITLKLSDKIGDIDISDLRHDLLDLFIAVHQQLPSPVHPDHGDILNKRAARLLLEKPAEVIGGYAEFVCDAL